MFKFLKNKLKESIRKISGKIDEEGKEEVVEAPQQPEEIKESPKEQKVEETKEPEKEEPAKEEPVIEEKLQEVEKEPIKEAEEPKEEQEITEEKAEPVKEEKVEEKPEKKGFFAKLKDKFKKKDEFPEEEAEEIPIKDAVKEYQKKEEKIEEEKKLEEKEEEIKEKVEKKEIPKIQELAERKEQEHKIEKIEKEIEEPIKKVEEPKEKQQELEKEQIKEKEEPVVEQEKKGFFQKIKQSISTKRINKKQFEDIFWELEMALLENNVAVEVIDKIKQDLENNIVEKPIRRSKIEETIMHTLKKSLGEILNIESFDILDKVKTKKPFVICFVGINGSGKTTTISKVAHMLKEKGFSVVLVAGDTWRQAAIEQLETWAKKLKVPIVKHDYGSDPAAVAFDGVEMAKARKIDVVLIDTAGRMHSNVNLVEEMKKIVRVAKPDLKIFIGESITGNDCVDQSKKFDEAIGLDGIILSKADVDEKGGAAVSVSYVTGKPIIYLGMGQELNDLEKFNSSKILDSLGLA